MWRPATRELWVQRKCLGLAAWESIEQSKLLRQGPWEPEQRTLCHKRSCQARQHCEQHNAGSCQLPVYSLQIH